jgi:hypothetical protein
MHTHMYMHIMHMYMYIMHVYVLVYVYVWCVYACIIGGGASAE